MPICRRCKTSFPNFIKIDGARKNLQKRKFCLECSPYKMHNTLKHLKKPYEASTSNRDLEIRTCRECGKQFRSNRRRVCPSCNSMKLRQRIKDKIHAIVGETCWVCNYGGSKIHRPMMDFHHIYRETKLFNLSSAESPINSWDKIKEELKKSVLVCCRCHREIESNLIDKDYIKNIFEKKWRIIKGLSSMVDA